MTSFTSGSKVNRWTLALIVLVALVVGLAIGLLAGKFGLCDEMDDEAKDKAAMLDKLLQDEDEDIAKKIMDGVDPANIRENLRQISLKPHIAGKQGDLGTVKLVQDHFRKYGLHVQTTPYDVLLSYPIEDTPNSVRVLDGNGRVVYDAAQNESDISQEAGVVPPFNAYSPTRLVEAELVYAGYGRVEDFNWLREQNIDVTGKVCIIKYGKIFRGSKVDIAYSNGAIGVILYTDPQDYTGFKLGDYRVYPDTWWLPETGAQRGTIFTGDGDPLTPGYPANNLAFRYPEDEVEPPLPQIPSQPIGYGAAVNILKHLGGMEVPDSKPDFLGALNISYRLGPGFVDPNWRIQLNVTTRNVKAKAENVFGIIKGAVEPDRYVLFGNHRDAWIYGAIDPSSGTAVMMEIARVMGQLVKDGKWRPRRSIMFCSWGAEEYGLIGSTEWVEQYVATLRERAIGYINVDIAIEGNDTLRVDSTPLMYNVVYDATRKVKNPNQEEIKAGRTTVYDTWVKVRPNHDKTMPEIGSLGSGSDFQPILQKAGITAADMSYTIDSEKYKVSSYSLYHTEYEKFEIVTTQFDRDFEYMTAVARVSAEMARNLADSLILPFNLTNYAKGLETIRQALDKDYGATLMKQLKNYADLENVIANFSVDVADFNARLKTIDKTNPYAIRKVNDQIMLLERAFLEPEGLPNRHLKKHLIFAENSNDAYAGSSFPGLVDLLFEIDNDPSRWEQVGHHFSVILHTIQSAGATLRDVTDFMSETL